MSASHHILARLMTRRRLSILGINSGTSVDGLDGCLLEVSVVRSTLRYRVKATLSSQFTPLHKRRLLALAATDVIGKKDAAAMHAVHGAYIGLCALRWIQTLARRGFKVDLIASHGQTIAHFPGKSDSYTWQIGSLNHITQAAGRVTIGDFRIADTAAGGMGAPLSGYYHHLLFGEGVPVLNIGGIANVSVSQLVRGRSQIVAFDTGPGNMIMDAVTRQRLQQAFDKNGTTAARGTIIDTLARAVLSDAYFRKTPPKTCGREEFGERAIVRYLRNRKFHTADLLASAAEITARSIATAVQRWIAPRSAARTLILTGGGIRNRHLIRRLQYHLPDWTLAPSDALGFPSQHVEPAGFAALAYETLHGRAGNLGGATGARRPAVLGVIALPPPPS